jgi:hypothetical protein
MNQSCFKLPESFALRKNYLFYKFSLQRQLLAFVYEVNYYLFRTKTKLNFGEGVEWVETSFIIS